MLAISRLIALVILSFSINGIALQITEARVGAQGNIKVSDVTPGAIVMKDSNKRDVLVTFYRTLDKKKKHQVGFSVARQIDSEGMLIWDKTSYILPGATFNTGAVPPLPIVFNNNLVLFGTTKVGHKKSARNRVQYAQFANLDALINSAAGGKGPAPKLQTLMDTNRNHAGLSGTVMTGNDGQPQLMLVYYHPKHRKGEPEQPPFSYALCNKELSCKLHDAYRGMGRDGITPMTLYNLRMGREENILMAVRHVDKDKHALVLHQYHPEDDTWVKLYTVSHLTPDSRTIAFAERNNQLITYFNNDHNHNSYPKGAIIRAQVSKYDAPYTNTSWLNGIALYNNNTSRIKAGTGINAVIFNGNVYGFYKDKHSHYAKYFREMD